MPLPSKYRWIMVGNLVIRNDKRAGPEAPLFTLNEVIDAAKKRIQDNDQYREYGNNTRIMCCSKIDDKDDYHRFLIDVGDKNTSGVSFINFETRKSRDIEKKDSEGGHYSAHVIVKKNNDAVGSHLILIEKVPGIYFSSLKDHLGWICRDDRFEKSYKDEDGKDKKNHPVFEIDGYQSNTIREALKTGQLQDVEFIKHEESFGDGLDEDPILKEVVHNAKLEVKQKVTEDQAKNFFKKTLDKFNGFKENNQDAHMFVRIKTKSGQIKRTEVDPDSDSILEQAFIQNELVSDFEKPLPQRYDGFREDMIEKMIAITNSQSS